MTPKRKFYSKGFQHIFQISVDRGIIFYTNEDCIVFFTILCCLAVKYRVLIVALCIMKNHFHILGHFGSEENMGLFLNALCSVYARKYNRRYFRSGQLFKKSFGSAPKYGEEDIYDCVIYIYNNPVPKKAHETAIEYRWNFLAYMDSKTPFSKQTDHSSVSDELRLRFSLVERIHSSGHYIDYDVLDTLRAGLSAEQYLQLLDHIIVVYNIIDYRLLKSKWETTGAVSEMLRLVKGSEYSTDEDGSRDDYRNYERMNEIVREAGFDLSHFRFDSKNADKRQVERLRRRVIFQLNPSPLELDKFFHSGEYARKLCPKTP